MPYNTEADFAANYRAPLIDPDTSEMYSNFRDVAKYGDVTIDIRLHYHPAVQVPGKHSLADRLIAHSNITSADSIILFGGAFGFTGQWIEQKTGAACVSVDTSVWVNAVWNQSADGELQQAIEASGLSISGGVGQTIFNKFSDPGPRCKIYGGVVNESLSNQGSRQRVIAKLPRNPTLIITEEVWQVLTDAERAEYASRLTNFGIPVVHVIDAQIIDGP